MARQPTKRRRLVGLVLAVAFMALVGLQSAGMSRRRPEVWRSSRDSPSAPDWVACHSNWTTASTELPDKIDMVLAGVTARDGGNGETEVAITVLLADSYTREGVFHPEHASLSPSGIEWLRRGVCRTAGVSRKVSSVTTQDGCGGGCGFSFAAIVTCSLPRQSRDRFDVTLSVPLQDGSDGLAASVPMCRRWPSRDTTLMGMCTNALFAPLQPDALKQWIAYHATLGVDKFFVYDREGSFLQPLQPEIEAGE
eukprot:TRINITY_DN8998_c0_g2_i3.p1 TRINITY_DN8998_c0_g2~~TRINITY_DN8998_c0_g2_i3.p1  ORF type:complete len:252 (+),score=43.74 TRINITY_DN8998_c0_g2_i3:3-758(+)